LINGHQAIKHVELSISLDVIRKKKIAVDKWGQLGLYFLHTEKAFSMNLGLGS
jgi:hypothetical protein